MSIVVRLQGELKQIEGGRTRAKVGATRMTVEKTIGAFESAAARIARMTKRAVRRAVRRTQEPSAN